jgi:hypothetical protein
MYTLSTGTTMNSNGMIGFPQPATPPERTPVPQAFYAAFEEKEE